jgi:precorrin-6B methylase 2
MNHNDHVNLLRPANLPQSGTYADFGAGSGAFTLALRELVGLEAVIYAVDMDKSALRGWRIPIAPASIRPIT